MSFYTISPSNNIPIPAVPASFNMPASSAEVEAPEQPNRESDPFIPPPSNVVLSLDQLIQGTSGGEMANQIVRHWLKDAATRIFHQPSRFFLELVVNALDASVDAEKNTGKFGLGFFSSLTFLENCSIHIETTTQESDKGLSSFSMDLSKAETYQVIFKDLAANKESGTAITITPKSGVIPKGTLEEVLWHCLNLQFYEHGKIEIDYEGTIYTVGEGEKVLAWVSLRKEALRVSDKGCGMSKEVACKKLLVPSSTTKTAPKTRWYPPVLPECKKFIGKKDSDSHFLVSINGVIVIDLPLPGCKQDDLLLKMPPTTQLTVARDAIENRPTTIHYLKSVIELSVQSALTSEEAASRLLLFYKGLKTWEDRVPSMAEAKLSAYLEATIHEIFKARPELIPYPVEYAEQLRPLLPQSGHLVAFPASLVFDHFESFEQLLAKEIAQSRKDLIAGKTVFFVEAMTKVSACGLRNCVFAPLSFLNENPSHKLLQLRLVTQFTDDGKSLETTQADNVLPVALDNLRSPHPFVFCTGRDSRPFAWVLTPPLADLEFFKAASDAPFQEFWQKYEKEARSMGFFRSKSRFILMLTDILDDTQSCVKRDLESTIVYQKENSCYWRISDPEAAFAELNLLVSILPEKKPKQLKNLLISSNFYEKFLKPVSPIEVSKLFFGWVLGELGAEGMVFTTKETLWPVKEITLEYLEKWFHIANNDRKIRFIASRSLSTPESQLDIWQVLEPFMDYLDHLVAIKAVLPLLLLQKEVLKENLSQSQQEKLKLCVLKLIACYHRFFTIKLGEAPLSYGETLIEYSNFGDSELKCPVKEIALLFKSVVHKPDLFDKCLDLLTEEMSSLLDVEKRNKGLALGNKGLHAPDTNSHNAITFLSMAKARGVDPLFIETLLQYARTPFELAMMSLLLLEEKLEKYFVRPQQKEKIAHALNYFITVYLQQKNKSDYEKSYGYARSDPNRSNKGTFSHYLRPLIDPMISYIEEIEGTSFDMDPQMTPAAIPERLAIAKEFTTIQVIHAAKNGDHFSQALKQGNLTLAIESARKESKKTELQIITQAVEHGSERPGVAATLIEAFQNAVDAIRGFLKKHPDAPPKKAKLSFDVRLVDPNDPHLLLEVSDRIGMQNLETLLADFLIPNYSKKSKDTEAVGEMGNGSFQMYREAEMVTVTTRTLDNPSRVYFLRIVPIRDPVTLEVIDLSHKCIDITDITEEAFEGTTLRVLMKNKQQSSQMAMEIEGLGIRNFISETFSVAFPPLGDKHALSCELKLPLGKQKPLQEINKEIAPFQIANCPFACYKMQHDQTPGFVLTDGYPFKPLKTFLIEEKILPPNVAEAVARGWCLNLPKGTYAPVQSRTHLQITVKTKAQLQNFLLEWIYARPCFGEKLGKETDYYPHMQSESYVFSHIFPATQSFSNVTEAVVTKGDFASLEAFFVHYIPSYLQKSFLEYVIEAYTKLVSPLEYTEQTLLQWLETQMTPANREMTYPTLVGNFTNYCQQLLANWKASLIAKHPYEQLFFDKVLWPWFEKKVKAFINNVPTLNDLIDEKKHLQTTEEVAAKEIAQKEIRSSIPVKELLTSAATILSYYCHFYAEHIPMNAAKAPGVCFIHTKMKNAMAYYEVMSNVIVVNLAYIPLSSVLKLGQKIARYEPIKEDALISISYRSSGTLNHELEHARRGQNCTENIHGHDYTIEGQYLEFDACAASYAKHAHQSGLFEKLAKALQSVIFPSEQTLELLHKIEADHPEIIKSVV